MSAKFELTKLDEYDISQLLICLLSYFIKNLFQRFV